MNIEFTMAGKYSRFKLFGAQVPKYLLPIGQETILSKLINEIKSSTKESNLYFIANRNDQLFYPILKSILAKYNIDENQIIYVDDTNSQLETATYASELIQNQTRPIAFANIDTIVKNRSLFFDKLHNSSAEEAIIDTFNGHSAQYSYVRVGKAQSVKEVVDNSIISKYACSGIYGFGSLSQMLTLTSELIETDRDANFTSLYNLYIKKGNNVTHVQSESINDTVVLGTPEEYVINIHRFSK